MTLDIQFVNVPINISCLYKIVAAVRYLNAEFSFKSPLKNSQLLKACFLLPKRTYSQEMLVLIVKES